MTQCSPLFSSVIFVHIGTTIWLNNSKADLQPLLQLHFWSLWSKLTHIHTCLVWTWVKELTNFKVTVMWNKKHQVETFKKYLISSALHVALLTAVTEAEVWNTVSIQYNKTTLILMDLFVTSWHREHVCCVQMYIETWVCVCVLLIRQRRGQLFLIRGSIATVITHGWAALTGLFFICQRWVGFQAW